MRPYLCSLSTRAGRETPRRRAVSLWFFFAAANCSAMISRSKVSTRVRSGKLGPGSPPLLPLAPASRGSVSESHSYKVSRSSGASASSRATVFSSSRTLPGHGCDFMASIRAGSTSALVMP